MPDEYHQRTEREGDQTEDVDGVVSRRTELIDDTGNWTRSQNVFLICILNLILQKIYISTTILSGCVRLSC